MCVVFFLFLLLFFLGGGGVKSPHGPGICTLTFAKINGFVLHGFITTGMLNVANASRLYLQYYDIGPTTSTTTTTIIIVAGVVRTRL